jgi:hypothetical protein
MSPRSIRRAAEHKARKLAAKQQRLQSDLIADADSEPHALARTEPRASASGSTGPRTPEGKAISSLNALKTGLTGRTVLLPSEDAAAYVSHIDGYRAEYSPVGIRETELVQSLADTSWRLRRIPGLEMAIYALGRCEFHGCFDEHDPSLRDGMIELQTHLKYEKQLRNLHIQESRLTRRFASEAKELRELQRERKERENATGGDSPHVDCPTAVTPHPAGPEPWEFEFSIAQLSERRPASNDFIPETFSALPRHSAQKTAA